MACWRGARIPAAWSALAHALGDPPRETPVLVPLGFVIGGFILKDVFTIWVPLVGAGVHGPGKQVETASHMLSPPLRAPYARMQRSTADLMRIVGDAVAQYSDAPSAARWRWSRSPSRSRPSPAP